MFTRIVLSFIIAFAYNGLFAARLNLLNPHDTLIRPVFDVSSPYQCTILGETGIRNMRGFNDHGDSVNSLRMLYSNQDALAMLDGFDPASAIGQLRTALNASDDGTRGHFCISGDMKYRTAFAFGGRFAFTSEFSINTYLPYYSVALENIVFTDQTLSVTPQDVRVKELLTANIQQHMQQLGCLDTAPWHRRGFGDWRTDCIWAKHLPQQKPFLKDVLVEWRLGFILPTAKRTDEDKLFAWSFGLDGSCGIPFGFGLELQLGRHVKTGLDVELIHTLSNTRDRRIMTSVNQTEPFLLAKTQVNKDFGLTQRFNLHVDFYDLVESFSLMFGYQYYKHGDDEMTIKSNQFANEIANVARSLDHYTMHHVVIKATYDASQHLPESSLFRPSCAIFTRVPFNGKNSLVTNTVGALFTVNF